MSKFTNGPWENKHDAYIYAPNGKCFDGKKLTDGVVIAHMCLVDCVVDSINGSIPDEVLSANARLIAAAPDMYKLLRLFHDNVSTAITIHHIITFVNAFDIECRKLLARIDEEKNEMTEKLRPCPFCGGKAQLEGDYEANWVCVKCPVCMIRTAHQTKEEAIEAWNRRAEKRVKC